MLGVGLLPSSRAIEFDGVPWILDVMLNSEGGSRTSRVFFHFRDHDFDSRRNGLQSIPKVYF